MRVFLIGFFIYVDIFVLSTYNEIKFSLNVPSLFRCKPNGRVFYFDNFPTSQIFNQAIKKQNDNCDLSFITSEKRVIFDIDKLISWCTFRLFSKETHISEVLFFKSNCSVDDRCIRFTPSFATIISTNKGTSNSPILLNFKIKGIGTETIQIGEQEQYAFSVSLKTD